MMKDSTPKPSGARPRKARLVKLQKNQNPTKPLKIRIHMLKKEKLHCRINRHRESLLQSPTPVPAAALSKPVTEGTCSTWEHLRLPLPQLTSHTLVRDWHSPQSSPTKHGFSTPCWRPERHSKTNLQSYAWARKNSPVHRRCVSHRKLTRIHRKMLPELITEL